MLRLSFQVEDGAGPRRVDVGPASIVAWERKTERRISDLANGVSAEDMAWMCWHAEKKSGIVSNTFDQYLDSLTDIEDVPAPKAPTRKGR
jgi:hypothetical protein